MIRATIIPKNHIQLKQYMQRKAGDGSSLVSQINNALSIHTRGVLEFTTPIFSGDLLRSRRYRDVVYKNVARHYITHTARDRNTGKPYVWYAEHGRGPAAAKRSPKKWMRYWDIPEQSNGNPFKKFAKTVGRAEPSNFIGNAVKSTQSNAPSIGREVIAIWLTR